MGPHGRPTLRFSQFCNFLGLSDKIFLGNGAAMDALFGVSIEDLSERLFIPWLSDRNLITYERLPGYPPTENLYDLVLSNVGATRLPSDFSRSEGRRLAVGDNGDSLLCTPAKYANCTSHPGRYDLPVCPE